MTVVTEDMRRSRPALGDALADLIMAEGVVDRFGRSVGVGRGFSDRLRVAGVVVMISEELRRGRFSPGVRGDTVGDDIAFIDEIDPVRLGIEGVAGSFARTADCRLSHSLRS